MVLESLGRRGLWDAVAAFEEETGLKYDAEKREVSEELYRIVSDINAGDLSSAIAWSEEHKHFLAASPHPSSLPYHLHRAKFLSLKTPAEKIAYARKAELQDYMNTQPVLSLITSCLYQDEEESPYENDPAPLAAMFRDDYCRFHGWAREEPLEVVVTLGSRGGALNAIEKARRVMGERLGNVRTWQELPVSWSPPFHNSRQMEVPLPATRRYHSVFVCPVSKEQTTDANPPKMLACGHVIAQDSLNRLLKSGWVSVCVPLLTQQASCCQVPILSC